MMKPLLFLTLVVAPLQAAEFQRELSADRPDTTENPISVEPGGFQVESSLWSFTKDGSSESWALGEMNLKAGLTPSADIQLVLRPWVHENDGGETSEGFGDAELRLKYNLWGNDGGKTAAAVMPYVSIPTQTAVSSGEWEGGIILPVSIELSEKIGLTCQVEVFREWDDDASGYDWGFLHSASLGIDLTESLGMFIEYVGVVGDAPYEATGNLGFTWKTTDNLQWDIAVGAGLNDAADDFTIAQGFTFRF